MPAPTIGIDVSQYQGAIDWPKVAAAGVRFAIARVCVGLRVDPTFARNAKQARAAGVLFGAYGAVFVTLDIRAQAALLCDTAGDLDLPHSMDFERLLGMDPADATDRALQYTEEVEGRTLRPCLFYSYTSFIEALPPTMALAALGTRPLWLAHYAAAPRVPKPWTHYKIWQRSGDVGPPLDGVPVGAVDRNQFDGDETAFREWLALTYLPRPHEPNVVLGDEGPANVLGRADRAERERAAAETADTEPPDVA
jgi:lysozyme